MSGGVQKERAAKGLLWARENKPCFGVLCWLMRTSSLVAASLIAVHCYDPNHVRARLRERRVQNFAHDHYTTTTIADQN